MVELKEISPDNMHKHITAAYWEDYELFEVYHIKRFGNITEAVEHEYNTIAEASKVLQLHYYTIIFDDQTIGYMVTFDNCLFSFAINIRFRQAIILKEWMQAVRELFNNNFSCSLYNRNKRAIEFMLRNNMAIDREDKEKDFVTLVNEYSCQS